MPDVKPSQQPHHALLGQILATALLAAMDAGAVAINPAGVAANPAELFGIVQGFVAIWAPQAMPKAPTTIAGPGFATPTAKL